MKNLSLANAAQKKARTAQQKRLEAENKVEELFTNQASKKKMTESRIHGLILAEYEAGSRAQQRHLILPPKQDN